MTIWLLALVLTAIACATLYYAAAGRTVNAGPSVADATAEHFRAQLRAIEIDASAGRMGADDALAAKSELAREVMHSKAGAPSVASDRWGRATVWVPVALVAVIAVSTYAYLGRPDLPAQPLAGRSAETGAGLDMGTAIKTIEARLAVNPKDLRGWQVIAPAYVQLGRYTDAAKAFKRVNELQAPTADSLTDQAEAELLAAGGNAEGTPMALFKQAVTLDPKNIRSRFYIAGEETRLGRYDDAIRDWNTIMALGKGDEPWMVTARNGLAFALQGKGNPNIAATISTEPVTVDPNGDQIATMVDGLEARLRAHGGSIDEWTQLVGSRLVQGRKDAAQAAYDAAIKAYPDMMDRGDLDRVAENGGLATRYHP
jgi:cytochrome c-type biogenesis protein CcmH